MKSSYEGDGSVALATQSMFDPARSAHTPHQQTDWRYAKVG